MGRRQRGSPTQVDPASLDDAALVEHLVDARGLAPPRATAPTSASTAATSSPPAGSSPAPPAGASTRWPSPASSPAARRSPAASRRCPAGAWSPATTSTSLAAVELPGPARPPSPAAGPTADAHDHATPRPPCASRCPPASATHWDGLLADARATYGVRDSNGLLTAAWPVGLLRRAMLEAGRRLAVARRGCTTPEHAVELTVDEVVAMPHRCRRRAHRRRRRRPGRAPPGALGARRRRPRSVRRRTSPSTPCPPAMRDMSAAVMGLRDFGIIADADADPLHGIGIGAGTVTGRALRRRRPLRGVLARFEPGDIMVTAGTCPAWNAILAHAGGVITEEGGPLSHAAVIARELGLPAVIGCAHALAAIPDGATVELDAVSGAVRVIEGSPG